MEAVMQTTLTVPNQKVDSFLDVPCNISQVKIKPADTTSEPAPSTEEFYEGLKRAVHDVNESIAGRLQLQTLGEFLDEYESRIHS